MLGESRRIAVVEVVELIPIFHPSDLGARIALRASEPSRRLRDCTGR
jgi:hypothetical protein